MLAVIAIGVFYALVDPLAAWMPKCPVKMLTGYDCPGCGSQRAVHAMLGGDLAAAWRYNAALIVAIPVIAFLVFARVCYRRFPRLYRASCHPAVPIAILIAIILWTIFRNL